MPDPGNSKHEKLAELLDNRFEIPGTNIRFGVDPVIGLLPGVGDWIGAVLALYFPIHATLLGAKPIVLFRMFLNIVVDLLIGAVPILGEFFDFAWKANVKNAELLVDLEMNPDQVVSQSRWLLWILLIAFVVIIVEILVLFSWLLLETVTLFI